MTVGGGFGGIWVVWVCVVVKLRWFSGGCEVWGKGMRVMEAEGHSQRTMEKGSSEE